MALEQSSVLVWSETNVKNAPETCGVYTLRAGTTVDSIGYVGSAGAGRLRARLLEHWNNRDHPRTTHFCWTKCASEQAAKDLESAWIAKYKPPWNKVQP